MKFNWPNSIEEVLEIMFLFVAAVHAQNGDIANVAFCMGFAIYIRVGRK